ncbi:MAG: N-acetylmuramoyl-L-alanine amidase [Lachnospiraceae bacterium]|nr:N-acetylmuramoyl-L-alanine amidase [Lachnospiraceae bacterium]
MLYGKREAEGMIYSGITVRGSKNHGKTRKTIRKILLVVGLLCVSLGFFLTAVILQPIALSEQELFVENALQTEAALDYISVEQSGPAFVKDNVPVKDTDLVILDPGHGGWDEGCDREGILEKEINLQIVLALETRLKEKGFEVLLTRSDDSYVSLEERIMLANSSGADVFVSIHQNAYEGEEACGLETWVAGEDDIRLGRLLHNYSVAATDAKDRGLQENGEDLMVLRESKIPACLVETGFLSNDVERDLLTDPGYQQKLVEGLAEGIDLYFHPKTMYLTFDDGPSAEHTETILDILKEKNVKATFFVIGENVRKYPETALRIAQEGHTIGIHCDNHDYDVIYESTDSFLEDFYKAYDTVYEVTGIEAELFRFPGGSINAYNKEVYEEIISEMTELGFVYFDWNASLEDAVKKKQKSSPEQLLKNAKESTLNRKKVVMLAHDTVENTALILEDLLEAFPEYRLEALMPEVKPVQF